MADLSFRWTQIDWRIPSDIMAGNWDKLNIYRSFSESHDYGLLATTNAKDGYGNLINSYKDTSNGNSQTLYYLATYLDSTAIVESTWLTTVFALGPREARIIESIKRSTPPIINSQLDDFDYRAGLQLSLQLFNLTPPLTSFTLQDFPYNYEVFLKWGCLYMAALSQVLNISIRDFNYSIPGGLALNIDRGTKINSFLDKYMADFQRMLTTVKINFASKGAGLGTLQLPLSLGGMVHSRVMNLFDMFKIAM